MRKMNTINMAEDSDFIPADTAAAHLRKAGWLVDFDNIHLRASKIVALGKGRSARFAVSQDCLVDGRKVAEILGSEKRAPR